MSKVEAAVGSGEGSRSAVGATPGPVICVGRWGSGGGTATGGTAKEGGSAVGATPGPVICVGRWGSGGGAATGGRPGPETATFSTW